MPAGQSQQTSQAPGTGRLIYMIGPSGAGKDSVIDAALSRAPRLRLAPRYITRARSSGDDRHLPLTQAQYDALEASGGFALSWSANRMCYGIDVLIERWLGDGFDVLVNGSRAALPDARIRYPGLIAVLVTASPKVLAHRLESRGREDPEQLAARLRRNALLANVDDVTLTLRNEGRVETAALTLLHALGHVAQSPAAAHGLFAN